jgi:quercetin dioxygenase-like cupin family protein
MENRRTFLQLAAALVPVGLGAQTSGRPPSAPQTSPTPPAAAQPPRELARHPLTGPLAGFDAVVVELNPGPGTGRDHRHTGPVLGYVLDGQLRFGVDHGPEQVIAAGGTFFEPTGTLHSTFGSANANAKTRVLAFMVVPTGNSGTVPA